MMAAGTSTTVMMATTLVLAATGISAKIDKAASKVFGSDIVKFADIAGAVYMGVNGGMGGSEGAEGASATTAADDARELTNASEMAGENAASATTGASAATTGASTIDATSAVTNGASQATQGVLSQAAAGDVAGQGLVSQGAAGGGINAPIATGAAADTSQAAATGMNAAPKQTLFEKLTAGPTADDVQRASMRGALIQMGGNLLAGAAKGYADAKQLEEQRAWQRQQDAIYRSGSGYDYTHYGPTAPILKRG